MESIAYTNTLRFNSAYGFAERRFSERLSHDLDANLAVITMTAGLDALGRVGKSTLTSLLFGVRRAGGGAITLDDVPIGQIPLGELRQRIVVVPHEIDVFTGTVAENIALALPDTELSEVVAVAGVACIDADIRQLPQGYDTLLGQGGLDLSAGQKQRLGIARALLLKPDILVLDESTSSLDIATETQVLDALFDQLPQTAILAITHRASLAGRMQRTIDLVRGKASAAA